MAKALEQELFDYILRLDEAEKKSVLQMLKTFVKGRESKLVPITIEQYSKEFDDAVMKVESGEFYTHNEIVQMAKNW